VKVRWLPSARQALRDHVTYFHKDNPAAAKRVRNRIHETVANLCRFPQSGREGDVGGTREMALAGLPYLVVYRVSEEAIEILNVFHTSTNWQMRVQ
jgi:toxin ParE1/3/4